MIRYYWLFFIVCLVSQTCSVGISSEVKMPLQDLLTIIREKEECLKPKPTTEPVLPKNLLSNYVLLGAEVVGTVESKGSMAILKHTFRIQVFERRWTFFPLLSKNSITSDITITDRTSGNVVSDDVAFVTVLNSNLTVVMQQPGHYEITFIAYIPIQSSRNLYSISLNELHPISSVQLNVTGPPIQDVSIQPLAAVTTTQTGDTTFVKALTQLECEHIITWRDESTEQQENISTDSKRSPQVTVSQESLHSVGDTTIQATNILNYELNHDIDMLQEVAISIHGTRVRVVRVTGMYIDRWWTEELEEGNKEDSEGGHNDVLAVLKVKLKRSVPYDKYQLIVVTEQDVGDHKDFVLPVLECVGVLRHQGRLGVVKGTDVEIHEISATGVAKADSSELSEAIRSQTSKSILLSYTFLHPNYQVSLQKTHHARLEVLDASIEQGFFQVMIAEDHALVKMTVKILNSNRQYLRVKLPENMVAIWSSFVNNEPVSPVTDRNGDKFVLVPLTSTMTSASTAPGKDDASTVELVYLTKHEKLGEKGTITISVPSLDVPINLLATEILFPPYLNPTFNAGDMKQISSFSLSPPVPISKSTKRIVVPKEYDFLSSQYILEDNELAFISNVRVRLPQVGSPYRFEKLLVLDEQKVIVAHYMSSELVVYNWWVNFALTASGVLILLFLSVIFKCFR